MSTIVLFPARRRAPAASPSPTAQQFIGAARVMPAARLIELAPAEDRAGIAAALLAAAAPDDVLHPVLRFVWQHDRAGLAAAVTDPEALVEALFAAGARASV